MAFDEKIVESFPVNNRKAIFRLLHNNDFDAFTNILKGLYEESLTTPLWIPIIEPNNEKFRENFNGIMKYIEHGKKIYLIVSLDNEPCGMGWVNINEGMFGEGYGTLGLQLLSRGRGLGIGKRLMNCLEQLARKKELKGLVLSVVESNPAFGLYKSLGYKEIGRKPNYVQSNFGKESFETRPALVEMMKFF